MPGRFSTAEIPGVHVLREYRRYYPAGEVAGHLVGFTSVDDVGQEGMELEFDEWLRGRPGKKMVLRDRLGRVIEDVERLEPPSPGRQVTASIDLRMQYLAYRELKASVQENRALSASAVVLDAETGEVLAMVNQPSYNPNDRSQYAPNRFRNRAITDLFEPGSSLKPLVIAAALESGRWQADSRVDTSPGMIQVGNKVIEDKHNLGVDRSDHGAGAFQQRRGDEGGYVAAVRAALERAQPVWPRQADLQRLPRRICGAVEPLRQLAPDRQGHAGLWLRAVGDPAATRPDLRSARRRWRDASRVADTGEVARQSGARSSRLPTRGPW